MGVACVITGHSAVIGTNTTAEPLTRTRIASLPPTQQAEWNSYLERSERMRETDQQALQTELRKEGLRISIQPPTGRDADSLPLNRPPTWYAGKEAGRIAEIVVSFQTPAGGWGKNLDLSQRPRKPGEGFVADLATRNLDTTNSEALKKLKWGFVGTIDNNATMSELRFLAKVITSEPNKRHSSFESAFSKGLDYLLAAQFPNGGWPQVWPLQGGYHDAITYNDNAMINVVRLLRDISSGRGEFSFTTAAQREQCAESVQRAIHCILNTQIVVDGKRTVWCQQHDVLTLKPTAARNYEMPSLCSSESAGIVDFLMELPDPDTNVVAAVRGAVAWLDKTQIRDMAFQSVDARGRLLVPSKGSDPLWSRYYQIGTELPIFGDVDKTIHNRIGDISRERRDGYAWFSSMPNRVLRRFEQWNAEGK